MFLIRVGGEGGIGDVLWRSAVSCLGEHGNDFPGVELELTFSMVLNVQVFRWDFLYLEVLGFEVAKSYGLVEVGMVDALEGADGLRSGSVVAVVVWGGTEILSLNEEPKEGKKRYLGMMSLMDSFVWIGNKIYQ